MEFPDLSNTLEKRFQISEDLDSVYYLDKDSLETVLHAITPHKKSRKKRKRSK